MNATLFKIVSKSCCLYFYGREEIKAETIICKINLFDYNSKINTGLFSKIALFIFLWWRSDQDWNNGIYYLRNEFIWL